MANALTTLKTMLSNSDLFQTWTGTEDATEALTRIKLWDVADADLPTRPYAVLGKQGFSTDRIVNACGPRPLVIVFADDFDGSTQETFETEISTFDETIELICVEVAQMASGGDLLIRRIYASDPPFVPDDRKPSNRSLIQMKCYVDGGFP